MLVSPVAIVNPLAKFVSAAPVQATEPVYAPTLPPTNASASVSVSPITATVGVASFLPGITVVPPSGKLLDAAELKNMVEASLDGWLTTGRFNTEFEKKLAAFIGVKHLITVNSGSSANLVAFSTLTSPKLGERAIRQGDEVIEVLKRIAARCGDFQVFREDTEL